ncbi:globin [Pseudomonas fluorescens]|uniref:Globin domain-containing protein n=1 Tax=Pseudomonas fluorescens TaxID=294 RepID=A0A5E7V868_PSEFL|nr:globin [Pseudomonas fluorescens]VVQ15864.1 hypothetical protein PS928_04319 [Pseudomonas fluorescens]
MTTTIPDNSPTNDAALLEETLEMVAERCEDLTPAVYRRFFTQCPPASGLFTIIDPDTPPMGCGQMLFEIISLLRDSAADKSYVPGYMQQIANEHLALQVNEQQLYTDFLNALNDTLAALMDDDWSPAHEQAWRRQITRLVSYLPQTDQ